MIYNEVNKFFSRPEAMKNNAGSTQEMFLTEAHRIASEPPCQPTSQNPTIFGGLAKHVLSSEIAGVSCLDASDYSSRSLVNSSRAYVHQLPFGDRRKTSGFNRGSHTDMAIVEAPSKLQL